MPPPPPADAPAAPYARVTGRGRATLALGVVLLVAGLALSYPPVAVLGAGFVALVLAERLGVSRDRPVSLQRRIAPLVVSRNAACTGSLSLRRGGGFSLVRTVANDTVAGLPVPIDLPEGARDAEVHVDYPVPTPRRGLVPVGPVRVRRVGPTGMAERVEHHGEVELVRVLPREVPVHTLPSGSRRAARSSVERVELGGTDLTGLHPYVPGDDLRRLHWASSAKVGALMVREDADPSEPHLLVLLDDRAASYRPGTDDFEDAVEIAAALCHLGVRHGNAVHLHTASGRIGVEVPASLSGVPQVEAAELALVLAEVDTDDARAIASVPTRDLDTAVLVSGACADEQEVLLTLGAAASTVVVLVDGERPPVEHAGGALVLRGGDADALAGTWELAVPR